MSTSARRRLMRDFKRLQEDPPEGVSGAPGENNIMVWNAVIFGPHDTPFEDGTFKLMVIFYPIFFTISNSNYWYQFLDGVLRRISQQTASSQVFVKDVPSQHLRWWWHLLRHSSKQVSYMSYIRIFLRTKKTRTRPVFQITKEKQKFRQITTFNS